MSALSTLKQTGTTAMRAMRNVASIVRRRPPPVGRTPHEVVHAENKWRLLRFGGGASGREPILLVPSLINRWYVLDLVPGRSLVEFLVEQGHDVFVLDWGAPGPEDRFLTFDDVVDRAIGRALRRSARAAGTQKVHVLGYCMGGTLALIHAAAHPERFASLTTLAAPVAFDGDDLLSRWTRTSSFDPQQLVRAFGNAPWPLLQLSFNMLRPTMNAAKGMFLLDQAVKDRTDEAFLEGFFAKERWANDNVSLAGEVFRVWIEDLYRADGLMHETLHLDGQPVRPSVLDLPMHVVTFADDTIVPENASLPLVTMTASKDVLHTHLRGGHVSAVVSTSSRDRLWPLLVGFWRDRPIRPSAPERQLRSG